MWLVSHSVTLLHLSTCPNLTVDLRLRKTRHYLYRKFKGKHHQLLIGVRNVHHPTFFISYPSSIHTLSTTDHKTHFQSFYSPSPEIKSKLFYIFDSDSFQIGIDNHSSYSISNNLEHFIAPLRPLHTQLLGTNSISAIKGRGTICWKIDDDNGCTHLITLPDDLYIPSSPISLLSLQRWAQVMKDHYPEKEGTWCAM